MLMPRSNVGGITTNNNAIWTSRSKQVVNELQNELLFILIRLLSKWSRYYPRRDVPHTLTYHAGNAYYHAMNSLLVSLDGSSSFPLKKLVLLVRSIVW